MIDLHDKSDLFWCIFICAAFLAAGVQLGRWYERKGY
jgi:hypothetical protein